MSSRLIGRRHVSLQLQRCPCFCLPFCLLQTSLNQLLLMSTVDEAEAVAAVVAPRRYEAVVRLAVACGRSGSQ